MLLIVGSHFCLLFPPVALGTCQCDTFTLFIIVTYNYRVNEWKNDSTDRTWP
jgi:hypothetical protein